MKNPLIAAATRLRQGLNIGVRGSKSISPTAYYTGYVWARHGVGPSSLATPEGRLAYWAAQPLVTALSFAGVPTIEQVLLSRHAVIDSLLTDAIESGQVGNVVEIASGMSPRGHTFAARFGDQITYVDTDLPQMAALKKAELAKIGENTDHHRVEVLDALASDGDSSLAAVCARLDHSKGLAIITEGLLNYLPRD
ncbi:MAG: class I SAM-dependent methyltransferase, partial [Aeromicrobium sp.]